MQSTQKREGNITLDIPYGTERVDFTRERDKTDGGSKTW